MSGYTLLFTALYYAVKWDMLQYVVNLMQLYLCCCCCFQTWFITQLTPHVLAETVELSFTDAISICADPTRVGYLEKQPAQI